MKYLRAVWNSDRFWLVISGMNLSWGFRDLGQGNLAAAGFAFFIAGILIWAHWDLPHMKLITMETPTHFYRTKVVKR